MSVRVRLALALALSFVIAQPTTSRAGDPLRRYFTIESDHFVVHFHDGLEAVARRLAAAAEDAHRTLAPALDHAPSEKTSIYLLDTSDDANGFAEVVPRNNIQLFATAPDGFSELDDHEDWMFALIVHEYSHVLHLDTMSGLPTLYNRIFGKTWAPNQLMPRWLIEGVATYEESKRSAGGRNRGTRFDQFIRIARHAGNVLRLDEVTGAPRRFPRGNAAYVYGSHFLRYVFDRFGDDTVRAISHAGGGHPTPYAINRQLAKATGRPFTDVYDEWTDYVRDRSSLQEMAAERRGLIEGRRLTTSGELNANPRYTTDGRSLMWVQSDGYRIAKLRAMPTGGDAGAARDVARIDGIGRYAIDRDGSIVFERGRLVRREYSYVDLHRWRAATGDIERLTTGARARDPALSPDGRRIAFSHNERSTSVLAVMDATPGGQPSIVWRGSRFDQAYQPAWSPDGSRIAFSAWREGGLRDILIVELASGQVVEVMRDRAIEMSPTWSPDGRFLYFDSDRTGIANVYAFDTNERSLWQVTNVLGGAFRPAVSPDGSRLAFESAVASGGYDLHEVVLDRARWLPARDYIDDKPPARLISDQVAISTPRPYRAVESLAPRAWTAQLAIGQDRSLSIQTDGADIVGLYRYQLAVTADLDHGDLNVNLVGSYNRWRPNLRLAMARTVGERGGAKVDGFATTYRQEEWSGTLSASVPVESRPEASWSLSLDYDADWFRAVSRLREMPDQPDPTMAVPVRPPTDYRQAGVALRVGYSNSRGVTYGVGPITGFDLSSSVRFDHPALGATYANVTVNYSGTAYRKLWGATPVLFARLAGAFRAGDLVRPGTFALGGTPTQEVARSIVDSTRFGSTGYLRGYPQRTVVGNQFHLLNLEYRQEVVTIERGLGTLPIYLRRITAAGLADAGTAFDGAFSVDRHLRYSVGGALRLDAFFGFFVPGTFEIGYSHGLTSGAVHDVWFLLTGTL